MKKLRYKILINMYKILSLQSFFCLDEFNKKNKYYKEKLAKLEADNIVVSSRKHNKLMNKAAKCELKEIHKIVTYIPVMDTKEIWAWNAFYGFNHLLKKYAGYKDDYKLKFVIDHGVYFLSSFVPPEEYSKNLPMHLVTSKYAKSIIEKTENKILCPISLQILYADDYYHKAKFAQEKEKLGKNLLVFPVHSCEWALASYDNEKFIQEILKIKTEHKFDTVTICLHYLDVLKNKDKNFEGYDFNIVTAGHMLDKNFYSRLKTIIKLSDVAMSNDVGSCLFYSIGLDKPFYVHHDKSVTFKNKFQYEAEEYKEGWYENWRSKDPMIIRCHKIFNDYCEELTQEQLEMRNIICDLEEFKTPVELRKIFQEAEKLYINGNYDKYDKKKDKIYL